MLNVQSQSKSPSSNSIGGWAGIAWNNPSNVYASDNSYATTVMPAGGGGSDFLELRGFDFTIPWNAKITGIKIRIEQKDSTNSADAYIDHLQLLPMAWGNDIIDFAHPTLTDTYAEYGSELNLLQHNFLDPEDVNDPTFGVRFAVTKVNDGIASTVSIDHVELVIYYTYPEHPDHLSVGALSPSSASNHDIGLGGTWSNPTNALSSNNSYATITTDLANFSEINTLTLTGFDFSSIPDNALIRRITATVEAKQNVLDDWFLYLEAVNYPLNDNLNDYLAGLQGDTLLTTSDANYDFEYVNDPFDDQTILGKHVNTANFGIEIGLYSDIAVGDVTLSIDSITVSIDYIVPLVATDFKSPTVAALYEYDPAQPDWTNQNNALVSDNSYATVVMTPSDPNSNGLEVSGFDFSSIPDNAIIIAIEVNLEIKQSAVDSDWMFWADIMNDVSEGVRDYSGWSIPFYDLSASDTIENRYEVSSLSNINGMIAPAVIKSSNFGLSLYPSENGSPVSGRTFSLDHIQLKVYYLEDHTKSQAKTTPGTIATAVGSTGDVDWTNPNNASSSNDSYATVSLNNQTSYLLKLTNWGFNIPTNARIKRINISCEYKCAGTALSNGSIYAGIIVDGNVFENDIYIGGWSDGDPSSDQIVTTNRNNLHELTSNYLPYTLVPELVNQSNFGIYIKAHESEAIGETLSIDHATIEIEYEIAGKLHTIHGVAGR